MRRFKLALQANCAIQHRCAKSEALIFRYLKRYKEIDMLHGALNMTDSPHDDRGYRQQLEAERARATELEMRERERQDEERAQAEYEATCYMEP